MMDWSPRSRTSNLALAGGEANPMSDATDFYQPLCVEHLADRCPLALGFLGLPAGWRFLTDDGHVDVWYDPELLEARHG
jgi:hypothetical protein